MATATVSFEELRRTIAARDLRPVYLIHGEEGYYIDRLIADFEALVPEEDRDYALTEVYGPQIQAAAVIDICRQIPMMSDRQVVILKEAQTIPAAEIDKLLRYFAAPSASTVFVVAGRGGAVRSKKFAEAVRKAGGVVFTSRRPAEWQLPPLISAYIKEKGLSAEPKALDMLRDFIGTDLSRMYNEVDKLAFILGPRAMVTAEAVERNVGISKDYNNYELLDAVARRDINKIFRISAYFAANPKQNPFPVTAATLFGFFADLLVAFYAPDRSDRTIKGELGLTSEMALKRIRTGMNSYNPFQVIDILHAIRRYDRMSKGLGSRRDPYDLLHELLFRITTTTGR